MVIAAGSDGRGLRQAGRDEPRKQRLAARHVLRVVDGRRWMTAESFMDFVHLFPDVSGFQVPLAQEIVRAANS